MDLNNIFSEIFEILGYAGTFSQDLYQEQLYPIIGLLGVFVSLALVLIFYFIINRPKFSRWQHWLIILLVNFLIAFLIGLLLPLNTFDGLGIEYETSKYITFGFKNAIIVTIYFIIWTYCFKWWKSNAKGTPKLFFGKF
ncbi:hypothetical protein [uncultured Kordia sp.]|uniref:hypothetical protein n=1 Tax=uncultured Kordia sp. TaxID=507699 RepID=UPI00260D73F5|nr:hypothetical protein [uncultured Kordia sp.]